MRNKPCVAVDIDGVVVDFLEGFERTALKVLGRKITRRNTAWRLATAYELTQEEEDFIWHSMLVQQVFRELSPLPGAVEAIERLQDAGYDVQAVTAITAPFTEDRTINLRDLGLKGAIHIVGDDPKTPVLKRLAPLFFVDDQVKHLHAAPFVPHRVWIRTPQEQFPKVGGAHTHETHSLLEFVSHWLDDRHHRLAVN